MQTMTLPECSLGVPPNGAEGPAISDGPPLPAHWVRRERLHIRLNEATRQKVTLLTGPPGSGKTTLVSGWSKSNALFKTLWLPSTDPAAGLQELLASSREPALSGWPTVVILDDIDLMADRQVAAEVEHLMARFPADTHFILLGRHCGYLSKSKLALTTQVAEIGGRDLDFTSAEAAALIRRVSAGEADAVALGKLLERTEGWAAGLRFATTSLMEAENLVMATKGLDIIGGPVWDYFEREVCSLLPADDVDFLSRASVAGSFAVELCEAVTGCADAAARLERFVARQLFVRHSPETGRYAFHPLFAEHLAHHLALEGRAVVVEVHTRAAEWFEQGTDVDEAMRHYVLANRMDKALALGARQVIDELAVGLLPGQRCLLPGNIPDSYFTDDPVRMYPLCASLIWASRLEEAEHWLSRFEISIGTDPACSGHRARVECLWAIHDSVARDAYGVLAHVESAKGLLDKNGVAANPEGHPSWLAPLDKSITSVLPWIVARAYTEAGRVDAAKRVLDRHRHSGHIPTGTFALGPLASIALADGRLREAATLARRAIEKAEEGCKSSALLVESRIALSGVFYERDELAEARSELVKARDRALACGLARWTVETDCDLARLSLAAGDPRRALQQLQTLREGDGSAWFSAPLLSKMAHLEFRCRLALGDVDRAQHTLDRMEAEPDFTDNLARLHLCAGRPDKAAVALAGSVPEPTTARAAIERMLLQARVNLQLGNPGAAEHALERALDTGRPESFFRVFLEEPKQIVAALSRLRCHRPDSYVDELLARAASEKGTLVTSGPLRMLEPLTERERELVVFLPSHLTQSEIARKMYISSNTVKTHMKGLYRKLGATSRAEAVELAQACGLL
jgi:LuxR family maltose regulon positive regulatory protein